MPRCTGLRGSLFPIRKLFPQWVSLSRTANSWWLTPPQNTTAWASWKAGFSTNSDSESTVRETAFLREPPDGAGADDPGVRSSNAPEVRRGKNLAPGRRPGGGATRFHGLAWKDGERTGRPSGTSALGEWGGRGPRVSVSSSNRRCHPGRSAGAVSTPVQVRGRWPVGP